eukprot:1151365-Pelagomonas_calceolata.AAC.8
MPHWVNKALAVDAISETLPMIDVAKGKEAFGAGLKQLEPSAAEALSLQCKPQVALAFGSRGLEQHMLLDALASSADLEQRMSSAPKVKGLFFGWLHLTIHFERTIQTKCMLSNTRHYLP